MNARTVPQRRVDVHSLRQDGNPFCTDNGGIADHSDQGPQYHSIIDPFAIEAGQLGQRVNNSGTQPGMGTVVRRSRRLTFLPPAQA
jgi:hypothetical protein